VKPPLFFMSMLAAVKPPPLASLFLIDSVEFGAQIDA
jgi:hypothetical protein